MSPLEIRRQTAEKLAKPPKTGAAPRTQKPIQACVLRADIRQKLAEVRARCAQREVERQANDDGEGNQP